MKEKTDCIFFWGKLKNIKTPTQEIMDIINENEDR